MPSIGWPAQPLKRSKAAGRPKGLHIGTRSMPQAVTVRLDQGTLRGVEEDSEKALVSICVPR